MQKFKSHISQYIDSKRIIDNPLLCYAYGTDASLYRMTPQLVVQVETNYEVEQLIRLANKYKMSLTFRAAGTSLSGQAITDQVLVILSNTSWQKYLITNHGQQITLEPGIIGANANLFLKPYATKIGPDPASINACKIGGIVANNSSGMCCGTSKNTYKTMESIKLILANGATLDTGNQASRDEFSTKHMHIVQGINTIRQQIQTKPDLVELIQHKFKIKNTSGYSLNAFLDYTDPIDILAHLMVGSEGTLGFISEITYNCVPNNPHKAVSLIYCSTLDSLISLTLKFKAIDIDAIELLDITSLNSIKDSDTAKAYLPAKLSSDTCAMLIEVSGANQTELENKIFILQQLINTHSIQSQIKFSQDPDIYAQLWELRKGILPTIGGNRPSGSTVVIEDIAVEIQQLAELTHDLRQLFIQYNYTNAAIFGHILAGNIHFVFTPRFDSPVDLNNYKQFMQQMCGLVATKYQGSLKAEHGCGRNIAPFVELEWGKTAYALMWQIKHLLDPNSILNPDVKLTTNPNLHLQNLKEMTSVSGEIDKCIECGFCEAVCPSQNLSLTPRQRITTYRKMKSIEASNPELHAKFMHDYAYHGIETCATTGLCATKCPVGINTGEFILRLRQHTSTKLDNYFAHNFSSFVKLNKIALSMGNTAADLLGRKPTYSISRQLKKVIPILPVYLPTLPNTQSARFVEEANPTKQKCIVYFPSCNNRIMGDTSESKTQNSLQRLISHLGYHIIYPENLANLCCGQVFDSNGDNANAQAKHEELALNLAKLNYPAIIDNSSCYYSFVKNSDTPVMDSVTFVYQHLKQLRLKQKYNKLALHIDCSSKKSSKDKQIYAILEACAKQIVTPINISCCGFAGNKGLNTPELNQSALHSLKEQIAECEIGVTFNRNCALGLSHYGEKTYLSLPEIILNCL